MIYLFLILMVGIIFSPLLYQKQFVYYKIKQFAIDSHKSVNHKYDGKPYKVHLKMVYQYALKYIDLLPNMTIELMMLILAAAWMHDTIEDCRLTYNDVKSYCGKLVADITFALSNEKGKTRKDRANKKYYDDMITVDYAPFLKICDRLANIKYSKKKGSSMFEKYKAEYPEFREHLYDVRYMPMFYEMEILLGLKQENMMLWR